MASGRLSRIDRAACGKGQTQLAHPSPPGAQRVGRNREAFSAIGFATTRRVTRSLSSGGHSGRARWANPPHSGRLGVDAIKQRPRTLYVSWSPVMPIKFGRPLERSRFAPAPADIEAERLELTVRPRRNRRSEWSRRMVRENVVTADDLIWPLFVVEGTKVRVPIDAMPDVARLSVDEAVRAAEHAAKLAIPCLALFPYTDPACRDEAGSEALNPDNLVCRAIRAIKKEVPEIGVLCDVALDPYTSHGHDGLLRDGVILNDETVAGLVQQALGEAQAGCDIIAPSDMMDGRVGAIRKGLDAAGFNDVAIMAYAAKYASAFYGPFRDAVGSAATLIGDK